MLNAAWDRLGEYTLHLEWVAAIGCLFLFGYGVFRAVLWRKSPETQRSALREFLLLGFTLFSLAIFVLAVVFSQNPVPFAEMFHQAAVRLETRQGVNLIPFASIRASFENFNGLIFTVNIIGNITAFMVFGFGLPFFWKRWRHLSKMALWAFAIPLTIETLQFFTGRYVDVDDVILNAAGVFLGYWVYTVLEKPLHRYFGGLWSVDPV